MSQESRVADSYQDVSTLESTPFQRLAKTLVAMAARLSDFAGLLAIICLVALLGLVLAQTLAGMLSRTFPAASGAMSVSWEYAGYLMGAAFMLAMPYTLFQGGHIRVNLIFDNVPYRYKRWLDVLASLIALSIVTLLAQALVVMTYRSIIGNSLSTASLTPMWIPEGAFAFSACLFSLQLLARIIALIAGLPPERPKTFVGAPSE